MNIIGLIVSFALFLGGLLLMGYAFEVHGLESLMFVGGIAAVSLAFALPIHLMTKTD